MKILLNKTKKVSERYYLINGSMGSFGCGSNHANSHYEIANGIDRGNGFQGYMSVDYFLNKCTYAPQEAKEKVLSILEKEGLNY